MSELAIVRTLVPSIAGVGLFIFVVLTLANASDGDSGMSAGACAVSAMSPIMAMSSLAGFDNQNGWERYRATLPFSRKDIICARYLCIVVFSAIMACAAVLLNIIVLPFFDHTGIPSTGQTVFEITIASAGLCRMPGQIPIPPSLAVCVQELQYWRSHYVQSAAPSAPRFTEHAICKHASLDLRRA